MNKLKGLFRRIHVNPIVKKDLRVISRSMKIAWGIFAYVAVLSVIFFLTVYFIFDMSSGYGYTNNYEEFVALFPILAAVQFGIIGLIMPILTATAVSGEKEKQTFDLLLTTVMSAGAIVRGKVTSAVIRMMVFIIASIPLMAISFTIGGLSWGYLFIVMIAFLIFAIYTGSVGIFASTLTKKSITAIILTYVFYFGISQISFIPTIIVLISSISGGGVNMIMGVMLLNPAIAVLEMFVLIFGEDLFSGNGWGLVSGWAWVIISGIVTLMISFLLQRLAAWRIDPLHGYIIRNKKKKSVTGVVK
ncbi:MAG: hypothetical protein IK115_11505 [Lachnospiraceae bacterium]|nr:hypothetical protein [Lachnospiraceae bacterium]